MPNNADPTLVKYDLDGMPLAGQTTPSNDPVKTFPVPIIGDFVLREPINTTAADYQPLLPGAPHPDYVNYPNHKLVAQSPINWKYAWRIWDSDNRGQDLYNYAINYSGDALAAPVYIRTYQERRDTYAPRTRGSALTVVYKVTLTNPGTGYDPLNPPAVTFSGGAGSGAAGIAIVKADGTLGSISITDCGWNYTSAPTVAIVAPSSGTTAAATAYIQATTALLVKEEVVQYEPDAPDFSLYFKVVRFYEVLPGPWIPFTRYQAFIGPIQGKRRAVLNAGQVSPAPTSTLRINYEGREGSSIVSWEIYETNSDGTGSGSGNPAYPILDTDIYDEPRGAVQQRTQAVVATGSETGTLINNSGTITQTSYELFPEYPGLLKKVIETWASVGPVINAPRIYDEQRGVVDTTIQLVLYVSIIHGSLSSAAGVITKISFKPFNSLQSEKITETWPETGVSLTGTTQNSRGVAGTLSSQLVAPATAVETGADVASSTVNAVSSVQSEKKTETGVLWTNSSGQEYDPTLDAITGTYTEKVAAAGTGVGDARTESNPEDKLRSRVRVRTPDTTSLDNFHQSFFGNANVELPPVLTTMIGVFPTDSGEGTGSETGTVVGVGDNIHLDLNCTNDNSNSAAMIPEIVPLYKNGRFEDVPFTEHFIFVTSSATRAQVFTKLTSVAGATVNDWPLFKPRETTFLLVGKQLTARARASARISYHAASGDLSTATSEGTSEDKHFGVTVRHIVEPASLHAALNIVDTAGSAIADLTPTFTVSASAQAEVTTYCDSGLVNPTVTGTCEIGFTPHDGSSPQKMPATNYTDWPSTGLYAKLEMTNYRYGYRAVRARVFDFATIYYS